MGNKRFYAILTDGVITVHAHAPSDNYATLCGLDGDDVDAHVDQVSVDVPKGAKINCRTCLGIFETVHEYKRSDFDITQVHIVETDHEDDDEEYND